MQIPGVKSPSDSTTRQSSYRQQSLLRSLGGCLNSRAVLQSSYLLSGHHEVNSTLSPDFPTVILWLISGSKAAEQLTMNGSLWNHFSLELSFQVGLCPYTTMESWHVHMSISGKNICSCSSFHFASLSGQHKEGYVALLTWGSFVTAEEPQG